MMSSATKRCDAAIASASPRSTSRPVATAYARAYQNRKLQNIYRVREAQYDWSSDDGVAITVTGVNYVESRSDKPSTELKTLTQGTEKVQRSDQLKT